MSLGFETTTPDGRRQITDSLIYYRLEAKIDVNSAAGVAGAGIDLGVANTYSQKTIYIPGPSLADNPVVALSSVTGTFARITAASGGINVTVYTVNDGPVGSSTLYVFSTRRPDDPSFGLCLYDASGQIIYSLMTPIIRPLGIYTVSGSTSNYSGVPLAGRNCAHIPQKYGWSVELIFTAGGQGSCTYTGTSGQPTAGYEIRRKDKNTMWMVKCSGSAMGVQTAVYESQSAPFNCSPSPGAPSSAYTQTFEMQSLIIDVTNI